MLEAHSSKSFSLSFIEQWRDVGRSAIDSNTRITKPIQDDDAYVTLREEIQKLNGVSGEAVNWDKVIGLCEEITKNRAKHLLVCGYLCFGLFQTSGLFGLACGLGCMEQTISLFWASLLPEASVRGRAFDWLNGRLTELDFINPVKMEDQASIEAALLSTSVIQDFLTRNSVEIYPGLAGITRKLQDALGGMKPVEIVSNPKSAVKIPQDQGSKTTPESLTISRAIHLLGSAALNERDLKPTSLIPYQATRVAAWLDIEACPPCRENSVRSFIDGPSQQIREAYKALLESQSWENLLAKSEAETGIYPLWLDLQRYSVTALTGLGPSYSAIKDIVSAAMGALCNRIPGLSRLQFSDGSPFADESTRAWLEAEILNPELDRPAVAPANDAVLDRLTKLRQQWEQKKKQGKVSEGVSDWQEALNAAPSERERFFLRFELAKLCFGSGYARLAHAQFEFLAGLISSLSLERWEPELARDVWLSWMRCLKTVKLETEEIRRLETHLYCKLCILDPRMAFDASFKNLK